MDNLTNKPQTCSHCECLGFPQLLWLHLAWVTMYGCIWLVALWWTRHLSTFYKSYPLFSPQDHWRKSAIHPSPFKSLNCLILVLNYGDEFWWSHFSAFIDFHYELDHFVHCLHLWQVWSNLATDRRGFRKDRNKFTTSHSSWVFYWDLMT